MSKVYRLLGKNRMRVRRGNTLKVGNAFAKRCSFVIGGSGNEVVIESGLTRLRDCSISIRGTGNRIVIKGGANLVGVHLHIEDDGGSIVLNRHVTICGSTELAVIEGKKIEIGEDCLFSSQISFRTGDSHSILDRSSGKRINPSEDITIGNHVWIGFDVKVLKGVRVGEHSIIGAGAVLTSGEYPSYSIIGGIGHGKVLKSGIDWIPQRIKIEE